MTIRSMKNVKTQSVFMELGDKVLISNEYKDKIYPVQYRNTRHINASSDIFNGNPISIVNACEKGKKKKKTIRQQCLLPSNIEKKLFFVGEAQI